MKKTNAIRMLDKAKIPYKITEYEVKNTTFTSDEIIGKLGMNGEKVFKTLVTRGDKNGINIFCIPIDCELDLKKSAIVSKNKKIEMILEKELLGITGYVRGGCSPIGMKKQYPTYINETALLYDEIGVSGGAKGCEVIINPEKLCDFIQGEFCDIC